jgi:preprotein translocase subunit SecB
MPTQLNVIDIRALKIEFSIITGTLAIPTPKDPKDETPINHPVEMSFRSDFLAPENDGQTLLRVVQGVRLEGSSLPFSLCVEMGGLFAFSPQPLPAEMDHFRYINCNAILFPYLREAVSEILKRGGIRPIYLPPVNFVQMYKDGVFKSDGQKQ